MLSHLDLFSGIGGFALACNWLGSIDTQQFVEIDSHCQSHLANTYPGIPIHGDITTYNPDRYFDIVTAGFPCQDISVAGNKAGLDGDRSGLFFEIIRIVRSIRPRYLLLENVAALLSLDKGRAMGTVLSELSAIRYDAEWQTIPASALGANHKRERIWIIAHTNRVGRSESDGTDCVQICERRILHSDSQGQIVRPYFQRPQLSSAPRSSAIAQFSRAYDGVPDRLHRHNAKSGKS